MLTDNIEAGIFPQDIDLALKLIKQFEGFRPTPYKDTRGIPTIGYGFNMETYPNLPKQMNKDYADAFLNQIYKDAINRAIMFTDGKVYEMSPNQKATMIDMSYNLGNRLFDFKKMQQAIQSGNMERARQEMKDSDWFKQTKDRAKYHYQNWLK